MDAKLKAHFLSIYCMAASDTDIDIRELETMYRIGVEHYGLTPEEINKAIIEGGQVAYIPQEPMDKVLYLYDLAIVAWADGQIEEGERLLLRKYALLFGMVEDQVDAVVDFLLDKARTNTPREEVAKEFIDE